MTFCKISETSSLNKNLGEYLEKSFLFNISWEPAQLNSRYISFVLHISFFEGGTGGNEIVTAFNYDLSDSIQITLGNLLSDYPDYLKTISDYAIKELESTTGFSIYPNFCPMWHVFFALTM